VLLIVALASVTYHNQEEQRGKTQEIFGRHIVDQAGLRLNIKALEVLIGSSQPDAGKIDLVLANADAFRYRGASPANPKRTVKTSVPIEVSANNPTTFVYAIQNRNKSVPLANVKLFLFFYKEYPVEITGDSPEDHYWHRHRDNDFSFEWPYINADDGTVTWHPFHLNFLSSGEYFLKLRIAGNFDPIETTVRVKARRDVRTQL
jgi:hypothetical protein